MTSDPQAPLPNRRLAAIMFSDIAGYTAIMGRDEPQGIRALAAHRQLLRSRLPTFNGRMLGEIGDGTLSSFHSAVDAVNCAREIQAALEKDPDLRIRIGIHVGDVVFSADNAWGDGVNIASRIHALAEPGGICISERVYDDIRNQPEINAICLGERTFKNVNHAIKVYVITDGRAPNIPSIGSDRPELSLRAAPDGTVSILFSNMQGSTAMFERLGDLAASELLTTHNTIVREQIAAHQGFEVKSKGDGFMVAFSSARRAIQCALAIQLAFHKWCEQHPAEPIHVGIGLHTGEAIKEKGDLVGRAVNLAARIAAQAKGGEILVSATMKDIAGSAGDLRFDEGREIELKGFAGTRRVHRALL
jgi:class 3 adenylate cyclase